MEYLITRSEPDNVIAHHGTKGMRWGIRLYQNKDGSLTPAGQKRYNKEVEKLKKETAKVKAEQKALATKKKNQEKLDKLEANKRKLEEEKKALREEKKGKKVNDKPDEKPEETLAEKKARLLKSSDPKELLEGKDLLSNNELQERLNRINLESQLQSKIPVEKQKSTMDRINESIAMYKKVDEAYSTVANSAIGKTIGKKLGLVEEKKGFDLDDFMKNAHKKDAKDWREAAETVKNQKSVMDEFNKRENKKKADADYAEKKAAEDARAEAARKNAQKQVDDYNAYQRGETESQYRKSGSDITDSKTAGPAASQKSRVAIEQIDKAPSDGKIYGKGTSTSDLKKEMDNGKNWFDTNNVSDEVWFNSPTSSASNRAAIESGQRYIALLEDKDR